MAVLSDDEVFGTQAQTPAQPKALLSDNDVFGGQSATRTLSDEEVFAPEKSIAQGVGDIMRTGTQTISDIGKYTAGGLINTVADQFFKGPAEAIPLDADEQRKKLIQEFMMPAPHGPGMKFGEAAAQAQHHLAPGYDPTQTPLYKVGAGMSQFAQDRLKPSQDLGTVGDIASGFGSLGASVAPALLGPAGLALSTATLPLGGSAEAAERARKAGASPSEVLRSAVGGMAPGATDLIDIGLARFGINPEAAKGIKRAALRLVEGGLIEGSQEGLQQFLQNYVARSVYKPDQPLSEGVAYNAAIGSVVGAGGRVALGKLHDAQTETGGVQPPVEPPAQTSPDQQVATLASAFKTGTAANPQVDIPVGSEGVLPTPQDPLERPPLQEPKPVQPTDSLDPKVAEFFRTNLPGMEDIPFAPEASVAAGDQRIGPSQPPTGFAVQQEGNMFAVRQTGQEKNAQGVPVNWSVGRNAQEAISNFYSTHPKYAPNAPTEAQAFDQFDAATGFINSSNDNLASMGEKSGKAKGIHDLFPSKEEPEITRGQPGANIARMSQLLGSSLYGKPEDIAHVSQKELLQNSFDAIKDQMAKGDLKQGSIEIDADPVSRTLTVTDNGLGMPPSVMGNEFLQIAATKKESGQASGGFGIAKMLFLFGNKQLRVTSMRDGKVHQMVTSGPELLASTSNPGDENLKPKIISRAPTNADHVAFPNGHGTKVEIVVPNAYRDPSTGETKSIPFESRTLQRQPALTRSPLFHNVDVTFNGIKQRIGNAFPYKDYTQFAKGNIRFDWGDARIYISKNPVESPGYDDNVHVLSNGIWQFDMQLKADPNASYGDNVQRDLYIDVSPRVKPEEAGYPFALNRQGFSRAVQGDFQQIMNFLSILYQQQSLQDSVASWGTMEYLGKDSDGVFASPPIDIRPTAPPLETGFEFPKADDEIQITDGKLIANGRELKTLTPKDLEKVKGIDATSLRVPQSEIDAEGIILHDNVMVTTSPLQTRSIVAMAREKFGHDFDSFMYELGAVFKEIRNAVAENVRGVPGERINGRTGTAFPFSGLKNEPVGMSIDEEYRGVSIRVPYRAAFLNPALPLHNQSPVDVALDFYYTMLHELAHHVHRDENHLSPWTQRLAGALDASTTFNSSAMKQHLVNAVNAHWPVFKYMNGVMTSGTFPIQPRGKRLATNGDQQARNGERTGDNAGPVYQGQATAGRDQGTRLGAPITPGESGPTGLSVQVSPNSWRRGQSAADAGRSRNRAALRTEGDAGVTVYEQQEDLFPARQAVRGIFGGTPGGTPTNVQAAAAHADKMNRVYKWMAGLDQLIKANPNFTPLLRYGETVELMHQEESSIHDAAIRVLKAWQGLGLRGDNLAGVLDDLAHMTYLTPAEIRAGVVRQPSVAELNSIIGTHNLTGDTAALKVLTDIQSMFSRFLDVVQQNAIQQAGRIISDPGRLAAKITEIQAAIANMRNRPYFPLMRFGRHFVLVKDSAGRLKSFETFERRGISSAERRQQGAYKAAQARALPGEEIKFGLLPENMEPFAGLPPSMLDVIKTELTLTPLQIEALEGLQLRYSPALSFKRLQKSNFTPGYSMDFRRAFARYFFHGGKYHSRTKFGWRLNNYVEAAQNTPNDNKANMIADYMRDHMKHTVLDATGDHGWFKGGIFVWGLGYSVYSAAQNLAQMPMVIYPVLAAKFGGAGIGDARAAKALVKAMTDVQNFYRRGAYRTLPAFESKAIDYGISRGVLSETQAPQLAGLSAQSNLAYGMVGNVWQRGTHQFMEKAAWMFEMTEQLLRRSTYAAALDLAQRHPSSKAVVEAVQRRQEEYQNLQNVGFRGTRFSPAQAAAMVTASEMTQQPNFVYARYARPRFMRGKLPGTLLVFQKYLQSLLWLLGQNKSDVLPRFLIMAAFMGGAAGLPGYDELKAMLRFIGRHWFGKDFNLDLQVREWAKNLFDEKSVAPDIMLHGLARGGFGWPALLDMMGSKPGRKLGGGPGQNVPYPQFDLSRMASTHVLPVDLDSLLNQHDPDKAIAQNAQRASGAVFSVGFNLYRAAMGNSGETNDPSDPKWWANWKRWEKTMPHALKDASSSMRAFVEGRERTTKGGPNSAATVIPYDTRDTEQMAEAFGLMFGFQNRRLNEKRDEQNTVREAIEYYDTKRKVLLQQLFEAQSGKNPKEIADVQAAIRRYNGEIPKYAAGEQITGDAARQSMETRARDRALTEIGVPIHRKDIGVAKHIQSLFPAATINVRQVR